MAFSIRASVTPFDWAEHPNSSAGFYWARRRVKGEQLLPAEPVRYFSGIVYCLASGDLHFADEFLWGPPIPVPIEGDEPASQ